MSRTRNSIIPSYRCHKPTGQAVVTMNGADRYLGKHGSAESRAEYDRLIQEWLQGGRTLSQACTDFTVTELLAQYMDFAEQYYRRADGTVTGELHAIKDAVKPLRPLYGPSLARDFGPKTLKVVREAMIRHGLCRTLINRRIGTIKRVFKWGVANELVPANVYHGLQAVDGLRRGRSEARESDPVRPVPEEHVRAVLPFVTPPVAAMIQVQSLTGMRPGEVVLVRTGDLDMTGKVWTYSPKHHKTQHHGIARVIRLGPRAQKILKPFLKLDRSAFLFSPTDTVAAIHAEQRKNRKSRLTPSQRNRRKQNPKCTLGEQYTVDAYRRAVSRGARKAKVPSWHPNQLRHNAATRLRKEHGLEAAAAVLGHNLLETTQIYAEMNGELADKIMADIG